MRGFVMSLAALVLCAAAVRADVAMGWSGATGTIVVAHDSRIDGFDRSGEKRLWTANGLASPSSIVMSADGKSAAILDGFADRVAIVSVADGAVEHYETPGTPVAAAFFGRDVWVILRDRYRVLRITSEGLTDVVVALDPAFIAVSDKFVYVYSRAEGLLQEIDPKSAQVTRTATVGSGGSDLEVRPPKRGEPAGAVAYVCRPGYAKIAVVDLVAMDSIQRTLGGAPIDLAYVPLGAKLSINPGMSVVADPGKQILLESTDPGPVGTTINLPTATDRIAIAGAGLFAFDSSSGTLYRVEGRTATKVASGLTATSFVATDDGLFTWAGKLRRETIGK